MVITIDVAEHGRSQVRDTLFGASQTESWPEDVCRCTCSCITQETKSSNSTTTGAGLNLWAPPI